MRTKENPAYKSTEVKLASTSSIIPYSLNNRVHSDQQVDRIANSIAQFGFNQPIVTDENNVILVGHGRLEAARKLGLAEVPVLKKADLTETQKKAYRILDNKLQNDSTWDLDNLELELDALTEEGFDLKPWGLDELAAMYADEPVVEEDDFEAPPVDEIETVIKAGDVIELGPHRVMCGDSTSAEDVLAVMAGARADLIWTDPPYGVNHIGGTKDPRRRTHRSGGVVHNDNKTGSDLVALISSAIRNIPRHDETVLYVASPASSNVREMIDAFNASGFEFRHSLVWVKSAFVFGRADYHYQHELILYGWGERHQWSGNRNISTVFEFRRGDKSVEHPTSKPIGLVAGTAKNHPAQIMADPFLGSGTTLIAADQLNRICYGMEISPKYCQVIVDRYKAHCEKAGKPFQCKINGEDVSKYISEKGKPEAK